MTPRFHVQFAKPRLEEVEGSAPASTPFPAWRACAYWESNPTSTASASTDIGATDQAVVGTGGSTIARDQARIVTLSAPNSNAATKALAPTAPGNLLQTETGLNSGTAAPGDSVTPAVASGNQVVYTESGGYSVTNSPITVTGISPKDLPNILDQVTQPLISETQQTGELIKSLAASASTGGASWYSNPLTIIAIVALILVFWPFKK